MVRHTLPLDLYSTLVTSQVVESARLLDRASLPSMIRTHGEEALAIITDLFSLGSPSDDCVRLTVGM